MAFLFSILSIGVIGSFLVLCVITRKRYNYSILELISFSILLGIGFVTYQFFLFYLFNIKFVFSYLTIAPLLMFILLFARYASKPARLSDFKPILVHPRRWNRMERLLFVGVFAQLLWILFLVIPSPVSSHDAVANYALKAKIFYFTGGLPKGFFGWSETMVAHPDYPLLLPFLMTWVYTFTGFNDFIVNMIMPVIFLTFLALFYSQIKRFFTRAYSLFIVFILATIPQFADYATIIHADFILTAFGTCAFVYFLFYTRTRNSLYLVFASLLFGFSLWIKNEAIVFNIAFFTVLIALVLRSDRSLRKNALFDFLISLAIVSVISAPWFIVKLSSAAANSDMDLSKLTPERLVQNMKDIPIVLNLFQQEVFGPKKWNIFWIAAFAACIWKRKMLFGRECFYITLFIVILILGYFAAYMCTTGNTLFFYVNTTISRFMLHFCPIVLLLTAFLLRDDVRKVPSFHEVYEGR